HEALELMRGSDIQVLVGFNGTGDELQVPAKLYEYLGVGRPVLALAPERGPILEILEQSGVSGKVCDPDDPEKIAAAITELAVRPSARNGMNPNYSEAPLKHFTRPVQVGRIASLLGRTRGSS